MRLSVAYGRVSTLQQANLGALERQERTLLDGAGADRVILDVGTATKTDRKGYQELLQLISNGDVERVLVADQDRLNRNLQADLELLQLCRDNDTRIFDLHGRELEFRTPDGELLTTVVGALNQHRSRHYGLKVSRNLQAARDMGLPATGKVPFGLRKVRDEASGRVLTYEVNPDERDAALQRIRWFLEGNSLVKCIQLMGKHEGKNASTRTFSNWLKHPALTGRLAWKVDRDGNHEQVQKEPSFTGLIDDPTRELILSKLSQRKLQKAIRNRKRRIFSGVYRCGHCGNLLAYRVQNRSRGGAPSGLRCVNVSCKRHSRCIRIDQAFGVMQYALHQHAKTLIPLLDRPKVDPVQVGVLQGEIKVLAAVSGTEELIKQKQDEINRLRNQTSETPEYLIIAALQSPTFWLQDDEVLNDIMHLIVDKAVITMGQTLDESRVTSISFKTNPAEAPLPVDQQQILIPVTKKQLLLTATQQKRVEDAISAMKMTA